MANIVVYDLENLKATDPETVHDLAGDEWRRVQKADGYRWTIVNGEITFEGGTARLCDPRMLLVFGWSPLAACLMGIGRGAMDAFLESVAGSGSNMSPTLIRDRPAVHVAVGNAEAAFCAVHSLSSETQHGGQGTRNGQVVQWGVRCSRKAVMPSLASAASRFSTITFSAIP